ncbi:MAG: CinA family nicotinamide mononucleotide deamidase-related protein [Flavobacteriales bacterium]|nr:CinA family nicotinamide mononucleotide deamidase-related protein [Flavobacteriales bacterium]
MKITAEIINIGDEILIGQIVNTNSVWMAQKLSEIGVSVTKMTTISDSAKAIVSAVAQSLKEVQIVLITGGLGPTKDDVTKKALADYFNTGFRKEPVVAEFIKENFRKRNIEYLPVHDEQAYVLENSSLLMNEYGTAPGMWIESGDSVLIIMPGVPYEMKGIINNHVLKRLVDHFDLPAILHQTLMVIGIPESTLSKMIETIEDGLPEHIKLAYLPHYGLVRLRLSGISRDREHLNNEIKSIQEDLLKILPAQNLLSLKDEKQPEIIGRLLINSKQTLSAAESCTGGYVSHLITSIAGSSEYFKGSVVSYSNEIKNHILGVQESTLVQFGAVSEECVKEMVTGVQDRFKTDYAIAITGIAGPGGGTADKPVGLVWLAVRSTKGMQTRKIIGNGERMNIIERASLNILEMLRQEILKNDD